MGETVIVNGAGGLGKRWEFSNNPKTAVTPSSRSCLVDVDVWCAFGGERPNQAHPGSSGVLALELGRLFLARRVDGLFRGTLPPELYGCLWPAALGERDIC
jgi:hypothetical protein